jgi:NADH-quinone oxidoreductase subunit N
MKRMKSLIAYTMGLILNLFIVKILISYNNNNIIDPMGQLTGGVAPNIDRAHTTEISLLEIVDSGRSLDGMKFETLKRISLLILAITILFNYQLFISVQNLPLGISLKDGSVTLTETKLIFLIFIMSISGIIIYNLNNYNKNKEKGNKKEKLIILKTNLLGIYVLIKSNDWILTIVSWELFNMSLYLFVSLKSENEPGLAASLKYFVLSALSTTFLLMGVCILYFKTGSTNYEIIETSLNELMRYENDQMIILAMILILSTLLFKLGAAPFYQWAPDLYENLDTKYTMWMIIIPKLTVLSFLFLITDAFSIFLHLPAVNLFLLISGSLSIIIGSIALNNQWYIKRFFAFSGISHIGFMLLSLYSFDTQSLFIYAFNYGITTVNIFTIFIILAAFFGRELKNIKDLSGLFKVNKGLSLLLALNLLSLAGVCLRKILRIIR